MTTQAKIGYGVLFKIGNGATPEVFTTVAEVTNITPPALARDSVDASHEASPESWREFIPGMKDGGEMSFDINFVPGSSTTLLLLAEIEAAVGNKQVVWTTGEIMSFAGFCTAFEPDTPIDDKMTASVTYKVSGKPTLA